MIWVWLKSVNLIRADSKESNHYWKPYSELRVIPIFHFRCDILCIGPVIILGAKPTTDSRHRSHFQAHWDVCSWLARLGVGLDAVSVAIATWSHVVTETMRGVTQKTEIVFSTIKHTPSDTTCTETGGHRTTELYPLQACMSHWCHLKASNNFGNWTFDWFLPEVTLSCSSGCLFLSGSFGRQPWCRKCCHCRLKLRSHWNYARGHSENENCPFNDKTESYT